MNSEIVNAGSETSQNQSAIEPSQFVQLGRENAMSNAQMSARANSETLAETFLRIQPDLQIAAVRITHSLDDSLDAVQQAYLNVSQFKGHVRDKAGVLYQATRHAALDILRKRKNHAELTDSIGETPTLDERSQDLLTAIRDAANANDIKLLDAITETGSLKAAGETLGMTPVQVQRRMAVLRRIIGVGQLLDIRKPMPVITGPSPVPHVNRYGSHSELYTFKPSLTLRHVVLDIMAQMICETWFPAQRLLTAGDWKEEA